MLSEKLCRFWVVPREDQLIKVPSKEVVNDGLPELAYFRGSYFKACVSRAHDLYRCE